jgi:hypothetical protein
VPAGQAPHHRSLKPPVPLAVQRVPQPSAADHLAQVITFRAVGHRARDE